MTSAPPALLARRVRFSRALPILLILILATVLRVHRIGHDSLWADEVLSVTLARMPIADLVKWLIRWEQIPPVHHLVLHLWIRVFGDGEASVRMPSALAGVAGVWMTHVLVSRLMGRQIGLIAALLLAVSPMHLAYSQECRVYTLLVLLGLISTDLFVRLLRRPTQALHAWYVIASALMIYAHLYGFFVLLAHQLVYGWLLWRKRDALPLRPRPWIVDYVALAALFSPWVPVVREWTQLVHTNFWVKHNDFDDVTRTFWTFSGSSAVFWPMVALAVIGIWRWRRRRLGLALLLALMLAPVVVPLTISVLTRPSYAPRYAIVATVAWCALAAAGIAAIRPVALRASVLLVLVVLSPFGTAPQIPRAPWRELGEWLEQNVRPGDLVVVQVSFGIRLYRYYVDRPEVQARPVDTAALPVSLPMDPPGRRVWLILYHPWYTANQLLSRGNWRIERRFVHPDVLALELTDLPEEPPPNDPQP